ncbi:hypothetical protein CJ030_MR1G020873 [Morella rubra]|uniref:Uncharacterized protein n=1 Tax=Morella rubra TaxID=262757 RepID=A0A6A1WQ47_9ROSI|nr:hypothetical protein CJ030_MR1G020873 [Morella rubra]
MGLQDAIGILLGGQILVLVNKSGKLDNDAPQYSVTAELTGLEISLNEVQLQQLLVLLDYLDICRLREIGSLRIQLLWPYGRCSLLVFVGVCGGNGMVDALRIERCLWMV